MISINFLLFSSNMSKNVCQLTFIIYHDMSPFLSQKQEPAVLALVFAVCCCVENNGVEPLTSCVQGRRSSQLS